MNILHVVPLLTGCSINYIVEMLLLNNIKEPINWFIAGSVPEAYTKRFEELGANVMHYALDENGNSQGKLAASKKLQDYIYANKIDLVHSHTPSTTVITWLATRNNSIPKIYTKHLITYPKDRNYGLVYTAVDRISLYLTDHIIPVSKTMAGLLKNYPFLDDSNVTPIQNAINLEKYNNSKDRTVIRQEFGIRDHEILFGFTGRLEKQKRLTWLLECFGQVAKKIPNATLLIAGVGTRSDQLKSYAEELGISDKIIFTGWRNDIPRILSAIDIYVQASVNEGLSLSILEAMASANAVIATDVGGIREIITSDKSGIIVPPSDKLGFISAMTEMAENTEKRLHVAKEGKYFVQQHFNMRRMKQAYLDIYTKIK